MREYRAKAKRFGAWATVLFCIAACFLGCLNPFFPPSGAPEGITLSRRTPAGVIDQLRQSYLSRQYALFIDLLVEDQFRFYVSPDIVLELKNLDKSKTEYIDAAESPLVGLVNPGLYTYLTFKEEALSHQHLFASARKIEFEAGIQVDTIMYADSIISRDTIVRTDTLWRDSCIDCPATLFTSGEFLLQTYTAIIPRYDTFMAAVKTLPGATIIEAPQITQEYGSAEGYRFELSPQVFLLQRDQDTLWKILKWFEQ